MIVQHLKFPFFHTIIYDFFEENELSDVLAEVTALSVEALHPTDAHHLQLETKSNTKSVCIDDRFLEARDTSNILQNTRKLFQRITDRSIDLDANPFLNYVTYSNFDTTFLQLYKNGSSYFTHHDAAVVTALYPLRLTKNAFNGGELSFTRYDYRPHLAHNCCLLFPSYEHHSLSTVVSDADGFVRASINQRMYIK
jgi:hypothetical protein